MGVVFRQSTKGTIVQLLGAFIGFLSTFFVIANFLTPEELGLTRVLVEASTLIGGYALLATNSSAVRYYPYFRTSDGRDNGFLWIVLTIPVVGILLFGGLYLAFKQPLIAFFAPEEGADLFGRYYYVVLPLMVFILYQTLMEVYGSLKGRIVFPKLSREVILRLLLLVASLLYGLGRVDFDCFILLFVASYGVAMLLSMGYIRHISPTSFVRPSTPIPSEIRTDFTRYTLSLIHI